MNYLRILSSSLNNFGGTFTFAGGLAPQLDANNQIVFDSAGQPVMIPVTSLERYRRTILFGQLGFTGTQIRALGGGATQLTIAGGNPLLRLSQWDFCTYVQDDWRLRPNFTLGLGLRYEAQPNVERKLNFAPRISFAWSPGASGPMHQARTVIRGGLGIFYERIGESLTLQTLRFNGVTQQQFLVSDPLILDQAGFTLDGVSNVPTVEMLSAFAVRQTTRRLAEDLQAPYTIEIFCKP